MSENICHFCYIFSFILHFADIARSSVALLTWTQHILRMNLDDNETTYENHKTAIKFVFFFVVVALTSSESKMCFAFIHIFHLLRKKCAIDSIRDASNAHQFHAHFRLIKFETNERWKRRMKNNKFTKSFGTCNSFSSNIFNESTNGVDLDHDKWPWISKIHFVSFYTSPFIHLFVRSVVFYRHSSSQMKLFSREIGKSAKHVNFRRQSKWN